MIFDAEDQKQLILEALLTAVLKGENARLMARTLDAVENGLVKSPVKQDVNG